MNTIIHFTSKYQIHSPELEALLQQAYAVTSFPFIQDLSYSCLKLNSASELFKFQPSVSKCLLSSSNSAQQTHPQSPKGQKEVKACASQSVPHLVH